jgi:hypothetical protein
MSAITFSDDTELTLDDGGGEPPAAPTVAPSKPDRVPPDPLTHWNLARHNKLYIERSGVKAASIDLARQAWILRENVWHDIRHPWYLEVDEGPEQVELLAKLWHKMLKKKLMAEEHIMNYASKHGRVTQADMDKRKAAMEALVTYMNAYDAIEASSGPVEDAPFVQREDF